MTESKITLGVQCGSSEAHDATLPAFLPLRRQLAAHCTARYSPTISEFAIILRICGSLARFEGDGVQRLRINRKSAYITADYVVPDVRWDGIPLSDIQNYLAFAVAETVQAMSGHLIRLKITVDATELAADVNRAVAAFLSESPA